jgi:pyridoxamine 5'-phosphate oxidase
MSKPEDLRKEYESHDALETDLDANPFHQFKRWYDEAVAHCPADWFESNAMTLATSDLAGHVTSRTVLLKHFDDHGFTFFTNYTSEKGLQISANSQVSLLLHWPFLGRQIRVDGRAARTSREISQTYFHSRPRGAQIGACVSQQSQVAPSREELERECQMLAKRYADQPIPLPEHWGGYVVTPARFEFWQGRLDRLHDCFRYQPGAPGHWQIERLYP